MSEDVYTIPVPEDVYTIPEPTNDTYEYLRFGNPGNTTQRGESSESKKNCHKATTVCLGLLCLLLSVGIIGLVIHNSKLIKELTEELKRRKLCETHGFTFDGGVCYYVSTEKKTWNASRQYCRDRQSDLMVINSKEKQDLVERVVGIEQNMWLGLTDRDEEGVWKWVDGTLLTTPTYWSSGRPKGDGEEDCTVFWNYNGKDKDVGWFDKPCNENNRWICERVLG